MLQKLIEKKIAREKELADVTERVNNYHQPMEPNLAGIDYDFEKLNQAKINAAIALEQAKEALINYEPKTAREHSQHAFAIIDSILKDVR